MGPAAPGTRGARADDVPPLIFCDGLGCDGFAWKYLIPALSQRHQILHWHYRGHGNSTLPQDPRRIGMVYTCEDLNAVMDATQIDRGVIFGHSMGVQVALEFHRRYARRVQGLVLVCGSYGNPLDTFHDQTIVRSLFPYARKLVETFPRLARRFTSFTLRTELALEVALTFELNRKRIRRTDVIPYFEHLACMDPVAFVRTLDSLKDHSAWDHLPHVDLPALVIAGEKDTFTPAWLSRRMAEAMPRCELLMIEGGTHLAPLEEPALVEERVRRFLDHHFSPPQHRAEPAPPAMHPTPHREGPLRAQTA